MNAQGERGCRDGEKVGYRKRRGSCSLLMLGAFNPLRIVASWIRIDIMIFLKEGENLKSFHKHVCWTQDGLLA